ncbi:hypothetical protein SAMN05444000_10862 [Shimia gijangensis]|uniref:Transcriptional activator HlyU n=1 Tax=Shimia gijangensis TaxID=1470563 RepID=A0A1M6IZU6_9RHOB|nr:HlyU family transcriptional regulator [Shimia gijangensis]SHJ39985.1 hypothetical protein SAMN05444000_10862 [Shimia gijangensis]
MSFLKKLFGGSGESTPAPKAEPVEYNGFSIYAEPINEGSIFRIAARIEKEVDGERRTQQLVRADTLNNSDMAAEISLTKAKQVIDERGERLFDGPNA